MKVQYSAHTHLGRRKNNEDALLSAPQLGLFAVADGMGGYEGGEIASRLAVDALTTFFQRYLGDSEVTWPFAQARHLSMGENLLSVAVRLAHQEIAVRRLGPLREMGSTLAALLLYEGRAIIGHVGDSRVYRLRGRDFTQLTRDHSLYEEMLAAGTPHLQPKRECSFANVITRALGLSDRAQPDLRTEAVQPDDVFLLCSDGLIEPLSEDVIAATLGELSPGAACARLVTAAFEAGGKDNITAVVVRVLGG